MLDLDDCGREGDDYWFCQECRQALIENKIPKFSARNHLRVSFCQECPSQLEGLTTVEEFAIALSRPFGIIIKLWPPTSSESGGLYHALKGHMIVLSQNPKNLLNILPSAE